MKVVRKYSTAARLADGDPILQIAGPGGERLYVVFNRNCTQSSVALSEVSLLKGGHRCGHVTLKHLDRLGNADHAKRTTPGPLSVAAFPGQKRRRLEDAQDEHVPISGE